VNAYLQSHSVGREPATIRTLRERLRRPLATFGGTPLADLQHDVVAVAEWRASLPPGYAYQVTAAFRQVFDAAVRWKLVSENPVRASGVNRQPPIDEVRPLEVDEVERLAVELGRYGPLVRFAAWTGLRPCEWLALAWDDVSEEDRVVTVRRTHGEGGFKEYGKTPRSRRRVPLSLRAIDALKAQPKSTSLVFTGPSGGVIDLDNFRRREWHPALVAAGLPAHRSRRGRWTRESRFSSLPVSWAREYE
jgi:integrase